MAKLKLKMGQKKPKTLNKGMSRTVKQRRADTAKSRKKFK